jgi:hypothetical protein
MQKACVILTTLLLGAVSSPGVQPALSQQTVKVSGLSATITITPFAPDPKILLVEATWAADPNFKYPLGCLSVYHDLRYELRDSGGHLIRIDEQALEHYTTVLDC